MAWYILSAMALNQTGYLLLFVIEPSSPPPQSQGRMIYISSTKQETQDIYHNNNKQTKTSDFPKHKKIVRNLWLPNETRKRAVIKILIQDSVIWIEPRIVAPMEPIISFAPSHLMIGSTRTARPARTMANAHNLNDDVVDSSMYSEMKELKRPRRSTTSATESTTGKTFNGYDQNNGNGNGNGDDNDDDYGFSEPFGNEMVMMENVEGLIWNETDRSATLVNQNLWQIPSLLTVQYASFCKRLDLSYNCLQTLAGIEYFNCLEELVLDNNNLNDSIRFFYNPFMQILSINKNKLTDLEKFLNEITLKLPGLTYLSMLGNPACPDQLSSSDHDEKDYCRYRSYVVHRMPQLKFLDSTTVKPQERLDAQKRGHYYRLIRLNSDSFVETNRIRDHLFALRDEINRQQQQPITPLPFNNENSAPKGAFGKLKHRYTGKHSEGNRFIRNHEL